MKKMIIFAILFLSATVASSQTNPKPGYIIANEGDTVRGNIDYRTNEKLSTVDSLLVKAYERGYEVVYEIVESNSLKDSLINRPFCSLFFENLWAITVKKEKSYVLYYGYSIGEKEVVRKEFSNPDVVLNLLFSLDQNKIEKDIYKPTGFYTPFYWYFLLSDFEHNKKFEWNSDSKSDDEYAKFFLNVFADYDGFLMNIILTDQGVVPLKSIKKAKRKKEKQKGRN